MFKYRFLRGKSRTANAQLVHLKDIYHDLKLEVAAAFTYRLLSKMCGLCWVIMENLKNIDECRTNRASLIAAIVTRILWLQKLYHAKKINNYLWLEIDCSTLILSYAPFYKILNCIFFLWLLLGLKVFEYTSGGWGKYNY